MKIKFELKLWEVNGFNESTGYICNKYYQNSCITKFGDGDWDVELSTARRGNWKIIPIYSVGTDAWSRIFAIDNSNDPEPIKKEGNCA